jgi:hypothetical protein
LQDLKKIIYIWLLKKIYSMKIFTRCSLLIILLFISLLNSQKTLAQSCGWSGYSGYNNVTPGCNSFGGDFPVGSGTYSYINVVNGANYTISTCGSSFDTQLTIYGWDGSSWVAQTYNDDNGPNCTGTAASVDWTSSFDYGNVLAVVNRYNCQGHDFTGTSAILKIRQNAPTITSSNATM